MIRRLLASAIALIAFALPLSSEAASHHARSAISQDANGGTLHQYDTEEAAQQHCPNDEVVWLNTNSGIYHEKGMRWYGNTNYGAYVCRKEADKDGDRDTRNGQ